MFVKFFLVIGFFITCLTADEFYINPYYLKQIQINSKSHKIITHYVDFLNSIKDKDNKTKIELVNNYINRIIPRYDSYNYKNEEYWASPFEFFSSAGGDCEDYVIAKMYSLKKLGIPAKDMYMSAVKEKFIGGDHMVLALHVDKNSSFLVLDNLSTRVLAMEKRVDLKLNFMFNEFGFFTLKEHRTLTKIKPINILSYEKLKLKETKELVLKR